MLTGAERVLPAGSPGGSHSCRSRWRGARAFHPGANQTGNGPGGYSQRSSALGSANWRLHSARPDAFGVSSLKHIGPLGIIEVMTDADPYIIAGTSLRAFVADWVSDLESGGGQMRGLLQHAKTDPQVGERYEYGAHTCSPTSARARTSPQPHPKN